MPSAKKSDKEKKETKRAQNKRYVERKRIAGLKPVTVYVPAEALEQVKDLRKIGVVFGGEDMSSIVLKAVKGEGGKMSFQSVDYVHSFFE